MDSKACLPSETVFGATNNNRNSYNKYDDRLLQFRLQRLQLFDEVDLEHFGTAEKRGRRRVVVPTVVEHFRHVLDEIVDAAVQSQLHLVAYRLQVCFEREKRFAHI